MRGILGFGRHLVAGLVLALTAGAASAALDCNAPAVAKLLKDKHYTCQEVYSTKVHVFGRDITLSAYIDPSYPATADYAKEIMAAAEHSLATFDGFQAGMPLVLSDIHLLVIPGAQPTGDDPQHEYIGLSGTYEFPFGTGTDQPYVLGHQMSLGKECLVSIYLTSQFKTQSDPLPDLQRTTAHELFHCVQATTWPKKMAEYDRHVWWIEGTAALVENLVYPQNSTALAHNSTFSDNIRDKALTDLSYETMVFFAWIWQRSPALMFRTMDAQPDKGTEAQRQNALLGIIPPADMGAFVRDYLDNRITMPDGTALMPNSNTGAIEISDTKELNLKAVPFAMFHNRLALQGGNYDVESITQGNIDWKARPEAQGPWVGGAFSTEGGCHDDHAYVLAGMAFQETTLNVMATHRDGGPECKVCATITQKDQCLIGTWQVDQVGLASAISDTLWEPTRTYDSLVGGNAVLEFNTDGTMRWGYNNFDIAVQESTPGNPVIAARLVGIVNSTWGAQDGQLQSCYVDADAHIQLGVQGGLSDPIAFADIPREDFEQSRYNCAETGHLWIETTGGGSPMVMRLNKVK